ncbi:alpha/beta fold hydrolase [Pseudoclavibacter chungangensis]|uniref:Alpha/beta fold hydrolase n=1 Tax=Pseudoclavibacter chungangensis TaxID=587635 RepID=A0A7J5BUQ8_9MICO|nr:alpha/beta fold hydrolase [Pseudoclavibacter chungangensis]KAB1657279.1 alpha/beta fold hydrolase [Pseudoclavibacter chungangensis]NYJ66274.1 pimeloyl-ACP methyl ester carboxylesterase [Pseudoclavibacter chungangensis]
MNFATTDDGGLIEYHVRPGPAPAPPLVLVQGRGLDHRAWDGVTWSFADRTLVLLDHRGTGGSVARLRPGWSTSDFADDVITVLDDAGIERVHVYGHSMGGRIAQWLGARHIDRVVSLVVGGASTGDESGPPRPERGAAALAAGDPGALAALFFPDAWIAAHPDEAGRIVPAPHDARVMCVHGDASDRRDGPAPSEISVPTLVLHGTDDPLADPRNAAILAARVPDAESFLVPGARHAYWAGRPEVHERVARFLADHDPR